MAARKQDMANNDPPPEPSQERVHLQTNDPAPEPETQDDHMSLDIDRAPIDEFINQLDGEEAPPELPARNLIS